MDEFQQSLQDRFGPLAGVVVARLDVLAGKRNGSAGETGTRSAALRTLWRQIDAEDDHRTGRIDRVASRQEILRYELTRMNETTTTGIVRVMNEFQTRWESCARTVRAERDFESHSAGSPVEPLGPTRWNSGRRTLRVRRDAGFRDPKSRQTCHVGSVSHTGDALGFPDSTICFGKAGLLERFP